MGKKMNIPRLRFPEFKGDWEKKKLGKLGTFKGGGTPSTKNVEYWNGDIPWISSSDLTDESIFKINISRYITQHAVEVSATKLIPKKSILIVSRVGVGKVAVNEFEVCTSQDFTNLILDESNYLFTAYLIKLKANRLLEFNQGTSIKGFVKSDLETLEISHPNLPEQTKIASFLSAVDEKLQALKMKKILLEEYKKGGMQKIFSQEFRFKDEKGKLYPHWEEKKLGEIFSFKVTNSFSRENLNYESGKVKNIHYGDIHTKFSTLFNIETENVPFVNSEIPIQRIPEDNYCEVGDVIFADASEDLEDVGKSIEIINVKKEKLLSGLHTILARPNPETFSIGFSGHLFKSPFVRTQIKKEAQGSKVLSISASRLSKILIPIPCIGEQSKIAEFLCLLDDKINHTETQIEKTEAWKKGLLQKMFV